MDKPIKIAGFLNRHRHRMLDRMLRVDHAGELGADRIYHGQSFVLGHDSKSGPVIRDMWNQEKAHLEEMEYLNLKYRTRKSVLEPFWSIGGFILGAASALGGPKTAMACTVAVEKVITEHYNDQLRKLLEEGDIKESQYVLDKLSQFRDDEQHHHETAGNYDGVKDQDKLMQVIDGICRASIKLAERI